MNAKEVYAKALHLLSVRFLSEGERRRKLQAREAADDVIDEVVEKLKTERFIDDERLAAAVYRHYAQKAKYGHAYICNKLRLRLLPLPEEREEYDETEAALALVRKYFSRTEADRRKIARYLQNRGFSGTAVRAVFDDFVSLTDE